MKQSILHHSKKQALLLLWLLVAATIFSSCTRPVTTVKNPTVDLTESKLVYYVSGEGTTSAWELEVLFNPGNVLIKEVYARNASRSYIYNKTDNEVLGLFNDVATFGLGSNSYFIYYTPQELVNLALSTNYGDTSITITQEFKDIAGFKCQKSIINHGDQTTVEIWTTDKIKTGLIYPWTPLTLPQTALEYEIKILGKVDRRYTIKSISDEKIDESVFAHVVPDTYPLVVPASVFSLDSTWAKDYKENEFKSFTYPFCIDGREATRQFLQTEVYKIVKNKSDRVMPLSFTVKQNGELGDMEINHGDEYEYTEALTKMLQSMPKWTPAKVKGKAVNAKVTIFI